MTYELVPPNHPALTTPCEKFDFSNPPVDPKELSEALITIMEKNNGVGLAANQVGLPYRMFVLAGDPFAVFNPTVVDTGEVESVMKEGCLTYPGLYVNIKRHKVIRIRFTDLNGKVDTKKYTGMTARIIQHEMDHLDGKIYYTRANKFHRDQAMRTYKKFQRHPERFKVKSFHQLEEETVS